MKKRNKPKPNAAALGDIIARNDRLVSFVNSIAGKTLVEKIDALQVEIDALLQERMQQSYVMARLEKYYVAEMQDLRPRVQALELAAARKRQRWDAYSQRWVKVKPKAKRRAKRKSK